MTFYIMWTWALCHEDDGRCLWYLEEKCRGFESLFPFCYNHELLYQGTQNHVSIQLQ